MIRDREKRERQRERQRGERERGERERGERERGERERGRWWRDRSRNNSQPPLRARPRVPESPAVLDLLAPKNSREMTGNGSAAPFIPSDRITLDHASPLFYYDVIGGLI